MRTAFYHVGGHRIGVGRGGPRGGGGGGGGGKPPNNLKGRGGNIRFGPPNNPPTFSFNFYVKQEKSQMYQVEGKNDKTLKILFDSKVLEKLFLSILFLNFLYYQILI